MAVPRDDVRRKVAERGSGEDAREGQGEASRGDEEEDGVLAQVEASAPEVLCGVEVVLAPRGGEEGGEREELTRRSRGARVSTLKIVGRIAAG